MLKIYRKGIDSIPSNLRVIKDVDGEFTQIEVTDTETTRNLMKFIDGGTYLDKTSFIDRFGFKLPIYCLSTGCKAGILIEHLQNSIVDTIECGLNAKDFIINFCSNGNMLVSEIDEIDSFSHVSDKIDIELCGNRFINIDTLNAFIDNGVD